MTEFKQIIGRGTRINEDYDKYYFTIMDFKKATELFADPDFDGGPVQIYTPGPGDSPVPPDDEDDNSNDKTATPNGDGFLDAQGNWEDENDEKPRRVKYVVENVEVSVVAERVQYYGPDGKLITESLKDYTRKTVTKEYKSLDSFLEHWSSSEKKKVIIEELASNGVFFDALSDLGTPMELISAFGGSGKYKQALLELQNELYNFVA